MVYEIYIDYGEHGCYNEHSLLLKRAESFQKKDEILQEINTTPLIGKLIAAKAIYLKDISDLYDDCWKCDGEGSTDPWSTRPEDYTHCDVCYGSRIDTKEGPAFFDRLVGPATIVSRVLNRSAADHKHLLEEAK